MSDTDAILERARNVFFAQWDEILRLRLVVLKRRGSEDIHDLRVATRRLRAAVRLLGPLCGTKGVSTLTRDIRTLTRTLGNLRNLDEALAFFGSHDEQSGLSGLMNRLADRRERELREILKALKKVDTRKLDVLVRKIVAATTMDCLRKRNIQLPSHLSTTSISLFETIQTLLPEALGFENVAERHALRIAIKKWRYFLELVSKITERDYGTVLDLLKRYQTLLGSMNDMTVFATMCRTTVETADELAIAEELLNNETKKLFDEFVALVEAEPLRYTFLI
jgi:CHAD domain-containing protein